MSKPMNRRAPHARAARAAWPIPTNGSMTTVPGLRPWILMQFTANSTGKVAGWGRWRDRLTIVLYGMNQLLPRQRASRPLACDQRFTYDLSEYGTPIARRSSRVLPVLVKWKTYSWQSLT